jgi:exodeoxyribonuclease VII large subunit
MGSNDALSTGHGAVRIGELYDEVADALDAAFPRSRALWVRGEIQKVAESSGHAYIDMVDAEAAGTRGAPVLKVKCWRSTWGPLKAELAANGATLRAGMSVAVRGRVDFYKPRAEIGFILDEVDVTALLGRLAMERAALIETLRNEGLLDANARRRLPAVATRIGLVGSPGTEGFSDFLGQLERSGIAFHVTVAAATVQGEAAPGEVARAVGALAGCGVDLVCVVRGGGSKADLQAFDHAAIARAIATCPVPVFTGIGHTGDESVADMVAHTAAITPTACGHAVAVAAMSWLDEVRRRAGRVSDESARILRQATRETSQRRARLVVGPRAALDRAAASLAQRQARLVPAARAALATAGAQLEGRRRLLEAFDPARQLERGWSVTVDGTGRIIRSTGDVAIGSTLVTRLADGEVSSTVTAVEEAADG